MISDYIPAIGIITFLACLVGHIAWTRWKQRKELNRQIQRGRWDEAKRSG